MLDIPICITVDMTRQNMDTFEVRENSLHPQQMLTQERINQLAVRVKMVKIEAVSADVA